jgi:hypothetical protein
MGKILFSFSTEKFNKKVESIKAIDECNLKIAEFNGSLKKTVQTIRKQFSIPYLKRKKDLYEEQHTWGEDNRVDVIKSKWLESLSEEEKNSFFFTVFDALKKLNLSFCLYNWMENYILYRKKDKIYEYTYWWGGGSSLIFAAQKGYPLTTDEKWLFKSVVRNTKLLSRNKYRWFLKKLKVYPSRKERRKRRIDIALEAIESHRKIIEEIDYVEWKPEKIRMTDRELAARLFPDEDDTILGAGRIKKLRQRYKLKLKK